MTNRVILGLRPDGSYGLRVSKPGYDVTNMSLDGQYISFDSSWLKNSNVFLEGSVYVPRSATLFQYVTVSFGTTLPAVPVVMPIAYDAATGRYTLLNTVGLFTGAWFDTSPSSVVTPMQVTTTGIQFYRYPLNDYTIRYVVLYPW